jgi:hypothetical protein
MPSKKKTKMNKKKVKLAELRKRLQNIEVISKFVKETVSRHNVRTRVDDILFSYLSEIKLQLPVPEKKQLHLNFMKVLGFCLFISSYLYLYCLSLLFLYLVLYNRFTH